MISWLRRVRAEIRTDSEYHLGRYGTFWHRFALARWRWAVSLCHFDENWSLHLFCLWVRLWASRSEPRDEMLDRWGFTFDNESRCLHLNWGHRTKILHYPWAPEWVRTEHGMPDGSFVVTEQAGRLPRRFGGARRYLRPDGSLRPVPTDLHKTPGRYCDYVMPEAPGRYRESFPYRYTLRSGDVQDRTATVTTDRMTWCWRLPWMLGVWFPKRVRTSINVEFSDEVGERSGSWKGGTIGCGYDLRPGETPEQCLRRMERERTFD